MPSIRISSLCLLVVLPWPSVTLAQEMGPQARELATRAVQLQSAGRNAEAADAYSELLRLAPDDVATHVNLGVVLVNLGRYDEALVQYAAADKLLPGDPRIRLNKALAYEKSGRLTNAEKEFVALHQSNPAQEKYTVLLADCESQLGQDDQVVNLLRPLYSPGSSEAGVAFMLGTALLHKGQVEEGERVLDPILREGNTAEAHFILGVKAFDSGDYPGAVKQLSGAVDMNAQLPQLQSFYGRALLNTGDPDEASIAFRTELSSNPNDYWANLLLGQILVARKQFVEATSLLKHARSLRPESNQVCEALAQSLTGLNQFGEARAYAEAAVAAAPESVESHRTLETIYTGLHLREQAARERMRVQNLEHSTHSNAPGLDDVAPDFTLQTSNSQTTVRLSSFRGKSPVVLVFGSYSCPNLRSAAEALKVLNQRYGTAVPFLLVYIREAHAANQWQSTRNEREGVEVAPVLSFSDKQEHATLCTRRLQLPFPALVDGMNGAVEHAYHAWPSRAVIVGSDGKILFTTRLTELDFHRAEMESVLAKVSAGSGPTGKISLR